jgi:pSer/pThr/pTyr-binding forkhead associated (FHA) protein
VRSFLLSALKKKFEKSTLEAFTQQHPHDWLVWEPGGWNPPAKMTLTGGQMMQAVSKKADPKTTLSGEALALALEPKKDGKPVVIGRAQSDFDVNDATVSLKHLTLTYDGYRWTVADLSSRNGSKLDGLKLGEKHEPLFNGAELSIGSVRLTYYLPNGMYERLTDTR